MALALFPSQNQDLYSGSTLYFAERDTVAHELGPPKKLLRCQSMNLPLRSRSQPIHLTDLPINVLSGYPAVPAHTMFPQIPRPPLVPAVMQIESASRHLNRNVGVPAAAKHVLSTGAPASYVPWGQSEIGCNGRFGYGSQTHGPYGRKLFTLTVRAYILRRCQTGGLMP